MPGLLIFIGLVLVILNVVAIKKQDKSFDGVMSNAIGNINDYDIKLGEIRREFSENIVELQSELMLIREDMKKNAKYLENTDKTYEDTEKFYIENDDDNNNKSDSVIEDFCSSEGDNISTNNGNTDKVQDIIRLFSDGRSAEEISEILQLGKGEVLLIKDLYIR